MYHVFAVTDFEVVPLAFAVLKGITAWLRWHKPCDVRCAVLSLQNLSIRQYGQHNEDNRHPGTYDKNESDHGQTLGDVCPEHRP